MLAATVDGLIVALLLAAIGLGTALHVRLKRWQRDNAELERLIEGLDRAAGRAEAALANLRQAADDAGARLAKGLDEARRVEADLHLLTRRGDALADRLVAGIDRTRRPEPPEAVSSAPAEPAAPAAQSGRASPAEIERALRALR